MVEYEQNSLYKLIQRSQLGDKDSLLNIINRFKPLISKLTRKLSYEEAETDLIILFIQIIQSLKLDKFNEFSQGELIAYLHNSLSNRCIDLFRKYVFKKFEDLELNLDILQIEIDMDTKVFVDELLSLNALTKNQREILKLSYLYEYSDAEIAELIKISRQAVNRTRNRGIQSIRNYFNLN